MQVERAYLISAETKVRDAVEKIEEAEMILKTKENTAAEKSVTKRAESEMILKIETKLRNAVRQNSWGWEANSWD